MPSGQWSQPEPSWCPVLIPAFALSMRLLSTQIARSSPRGSTPSQRSQPAWTQRLTGSVGVVTPPGPRIRQVNGSVWKPTAFGLPGGTLGSIHRWRTNERR